MAEPHTWEYRDPEPGPEVDAVYFQDNTEMAEREIWWRFGDRWRCSSYPAGVAWQHLSFLGTLHEAQSEVFDHHADV